LVLTTIQIKTDTLTATEIAIDEETGEEIEMGHGVVAAGKTDPLGVGSRTYQPPLEQNVKKQPFLPETSQWLHPIPCHHPPTLPTLLSQTHPLVQMVTSFP
jgi:hypothetical protein